MSVQDELRRMAGLPGLAAYRDALLAAARRIDTVEAEAVGRDAVIRLHKNGAEIVCRENLRLKARVNELAELIREFRLVRGIADAKEINTEPE